MGFLPLG